MALLGAAAARHIAELRTYYEEKGRPEATANLLAAVSKATVRIDGAPEAGLLAPRAYPALAREGRRWIKEGRYWFYYSLTDPAVILAVMFETADLPSRIRDPG